MGARKYQVEMLSKEDRAFIDGWLVDHSFHSMARLQIELRDRGLQIGLSALTRYRDDLKHRREDGRAKI